MLLFSDDRETVGLEYWDATAEIDLWVTDGLEIFVIEGSFWESNQEFRATLGYAYLWDLGFERDRKAVRFG